MSRLAKKLESAFDRDFYLRANPDVRAAGMDPLEHYLKYGIAEQRQPHPLFDPTHYGNSLLHFLRTGQGRSTHPLFDCDAYAASRPGLNPLVDYIQRGAPPAVEGSQFGQC
jgi:hypothetical protein